MSQPMLTEIRGDTTVAVWPASDLDEALTCACPELGAGARRQVADAVRAGRPGAEHGVAWQPLPYPRAAIDAAARAVGDVMRAHGARVRLVRRRGGWRAVLDGAVVLSIGVPEDDAGCDAIGRPLRVDCLSAVRWCSADELRPTALWVAAPLAMAAVRSRALAALAAYVVRGEGTVQTEAPPPGPWAGLARSDGGVVGLYRWDVGPGRSGVGTVTRDSLSVSRVSRYARVSGAEASRALLRAMRD